MKVIDLYGAQGRNIRSANGAHPTGPRTSAGLSRRFAPRLEPGGSLPSAKAETNKKGPTSWSLFFVRGAQGRNRTTDTGIFNPLLYRLSYLGLLIFALKLWKFLAGQNEARIKTIHLFGVKPEMACLLQKTKLILTGGRSPRLHRLFRR